MRLVEDSTSSDERAKRLRANSDRVPFVVCAEMTLLFEVVLGNLKYYSETTK